MNVYTSCSETDATCTVLLQSKRSRGQPAELLTCAGGPASCPLGSTVPAAVGTSDEITTKRQVSSLNAQYCPSSHLQHCNID